MQIRMHEVGRPANASHQLATPRAVDAIDAIGEPLHAAFLLQQAAEQKAELFLVPLRISQTARSMPLNETQRGRDAPVVRAQGLREFNGRGLRLSVCVQRAAQIEARRTERSPAPCAGERKWKKLYASCAQSMRLL